MEYKTLLNLPLPTWSSFCSSLRLLEGAMEGFVVPFVVTTLSKIWIAACGFVNVSLLTSKLERDSGITVFESATGEETGIGGGRSGLFWPFVELVSGELELWERWGISSTKLSGKTPIWKVQIRSMGVVILYLIDI